MYPQGYPRTYANLAYHRDASACAWSANFRAISPLFLSSIWPLDFIERLIEIGGNLNSIKRLVKIRVDVIFIMVGRIYVFHDGLGLHYRTNHIEDELWN